MDSLGSARSETFIQQYLHVFRSDGCAICNISWTVMVLTPNQFSLNFYEKVFNEVRPFLIKDKPFINVLFIYFSIFSVCEYSRGQLPQC